ncbi:MAG: exodeoxyribonuclease VII large subunit [Bacteroidetes bacterium]|nr:exodeoxyribonuclease VII large subunit [Bacteroidota bacterium]MBU1720610.1 exodeoxyribonuclease VII large subunit [Bacteroidota bacterium]
MSDFIKQPYATLSEVAARISSVVRSSFGFGLWIKAEIAKLNLYPKSGHCYPELVEKKDGKILAQMRATIWAEPFVKISNYFREQTKQELSEGMTILFFARVDFHPVYGFSLNISEIDPAFTLGEMFREKQRTIEKLKSHGIFNLNREKEIPALPLRIAVVSVITSKGYNDFLRIMMEHALRFRYTITLFPALLQGDNAVKSLLSALSEIRENPDNFDVAAIIRGGGGDIGLNCYDNIELATEIATFPIPVITGIGHSTNETVAEMVSCVNKITPTDVAYHITQNYLIFEEKLSESANSIAGIVNQTIISEKETLRHLSNTISKAVAGIKKIETIKLNTQQNLIFTRSKQNLHSANNLLQQHKVALSQRCREYMRLPEEQLANAARVLKNSYARLLKDQTIHIHHLQRSVELQDPEKLMKKGYSMTFHKGKILKELNDLKKGDEIETKTATGTLVSEVIKVK